MSEQSPGRRLLLRAAITRGGAPTTITHTFELSPKRAVVRCDEPVEIDEQVTLELSFPGLFEPLEVGAKVVDRKPAAGTAEPGTWTLELDHSGTDAPLRALFDSPASKSESPYRVLVVEDNPMARDVLAASARQYFGPESRAEIGFAVSIEDAWAKLQDTPPDLLIGDYYLPDGTGDELIRRIRSTPELQNTTVVAASIGGEQAQEATMRAGADFFIDKPMILRDLFATIDLLGGLRP